MGAIGRKRVEKKTGMEILDRNMDVEVIVRTVSFPEQSSETMDQFFERTAAGLNKKYPNLQLKIPAKIKAISGLSSQMNAKWRKFSDKEIAAMGKMEKYMEKEEILESLY